MTKLTWLKCAGFLLLLAAVSYLSNQLFDIQGGIFALVDIGLLPLFIYAGFDLESKISGKFGLESNGLLGAAIGGGVGNLLTDLIGASFDPTMHPMLPGIGIFGTLSLGVIYILHASGRKDDA